MATPKSNGDLVYRQFKENAPRTPVRNRYEETLSNRLTRIRRRANILFYVPENDPATLTREPDAEILADHRRRGAQLGAMAVAMARGINRR